MRKLLKHRKAMSPVIAAIILIAVTVAVSIAVAAWMGALTIGFMKTEELKIVGVEFPDTVTVKITVRNVGTAKAVIVNIKVEEEVVKIDPVTESLTDADLTLAPGDGGWVQGTCSALTPGTTYNVAVVTAAGNVFPYRALCPTTTTAPAA